MRSIMNNQRILVLSLALAASACDEAGKPAPGVRTATQAIYNGTRLGVSDFTGVVSVQGEHAANGGLGDTRSGFPGTGTFIKSRCVITAAHVIPSIGSFNEVRLSSGTTLDKWARVLRTEPFPGASPDVPCGESCDGNWPAGLDLRRIWTAPSGRAPSTTDVDGLPDRQGRNGGGDVLLPHEFSNITNPPPGGSGGDYAVHDIGAGKLDKDQAVAVRFVGYGTSHVTAAQPESGYGFKRDGLGTIVAYQAVDVRRGQEIAADVYRVHAQSPRHPQNVCSGDSGGPMFLAFGSALYGVTFQGGATNTSSTSPTFGACPEVDSFFTGLYPERSLNPFATGTPAWLASTKDYYCTPKFGVTVAIIDGNPASRVQATLPPTWLPDAPPSGMRSIDCQSPDLGPNTVVTCEAHDLSAGQVTLTASGDASRPFLRWGDRGPPHRAGECPCHGSRDPVCTFTTEEGKFEDELGGYYCNAEYSRSIEGIWVQTEGNTVRLKVRKIGEDRYVGSYIGDPRAGHGTLHGCVIGDFARASSVWRGQNNISEGDPDPANDFVFAIGSFALRYEQGSSASEDRLLGALHGDTATDGITFVGRNNLPLGSPSCSARESPFNLIRESETPGTQTECPDRSPQVPCARP